MGRPQGKALSLYNVLCGLQRRRLQGSTCGAHIHGNTIEQALAEAARRDLALHTFALYYDHESAATSVCIDTADISRHSGGHQR